MAPWFDEFTKQLATGKFSRRTLIGGLAATVSASATATPWQAAFGAVPRRAGAMPAGKSLTFGPCAAQAKLGHYERHLTSRSSAAGRAVVLRHTHSYDAAGGTTLETTILMDGQPVLDISRTGSQSSKSYKLTVSNAFGFKKAVMTSADGTTLEGEIDGRKIVPYTAGSGSAKVKFADGTPFNPRPQPGLGDALRTAFTQANKDLQLCVPPAQAHVGDVRRVAGGPQIADHRQLLKKKVANNGSYPGQFGAPMSAQNLNALLTRGCVRCGNNCTSNSNSCENDAALALALSFGADLKAYYDLTVKCPEDDWNCLAKCNASHACLGQLCPGEAPAPGSSPYLTCDKGDVCVKTFGGNTGGYCCPRAYPTPCPGSWGNIGAPGGDQTIIAGVLGNNICCSGTCLFTGFGTGVGAGYGYQCCPKGRVTCSSGKGQPGTCCPPGNVCVEPAPVDGLKPIEKTCCSPNEIRHGKCCPGGQGRGWCGDQCCSGPCNGDKCGTLNLGGQTGNSSKCRAPLQTCTSAMKNSTGTKTVCCPKGRACFNGRCCKAGKMVCANPSRGNAMGCWPISVCSPTPK